MNNSRRLGLTLFSLAVIIFFGQKYALTFVSMIAFLLVPPENGSYGVIWQSYSAIYVICIILIIAGGVIFFRGRGESDLASATTSES